MAKDPAFLFYYQDFLVGVEFMDDAEVGQYIRILCHLAHQGTLTEKHILSICSAHAIPESIRSKLKQDESGNYYNPRLREETEKRRKYTESRRKNASSEKHMQSISSAYAQHMENENENKDTINSYEKMFEKIAEEFKLSEEIKEVFLDWLKYKSEKRQSYKPTGMKSLIKTKMAESGGDVKVLRSMVDSSISNNYDGLFKPKGWVEKKEQKNSSDTDQLLKEMRAKRGH